MASGTAEPRTDAACGSRAAREFAAFAVVGAAATLCHYAIMVALIEAAGVGPVAASCVGAVAGALVSYRLNYTHTFASTQRHVVALPRFTLVAMLAFVANGALLAAILRSTSMPYLVAQGLTTLAVMTLTFAAGRLWAFR
jgi:putative flippase GtrA